MRRLKKSFAGSTACSRGRSISSTASLGAADSAWLQARNQGLDFFERFGIQFVVNPASILPVTDDPRILENAEMERQTGLSGIEAIGELAHASLSAAEQPDDLESGLVGEGVEQPDRSVRSGLGCCSHKKKYIKISCYVNGLLPAFGSLPRIFITLKMTKRRE